MGIKNEATVEEAVLKARRRRHRNTLLTEVEAELTKVEEKICENSEDVCLWKYKSGFKEKFSTRETWELLREEHTHCSWGRGIWFAQATPKFAFLTWLAMLNRLATMDRIEKWSQGVDVTCVLCKSAGEFRNHLFFECSYTSQLWEHLVKGILGRDFTTDWSEVVVLLSRVDNDKKRSFCTRYAFQAIVHTVWMERNKIRHGEKPLPLEVMKKRIDKGVSNKLSIMRLKGGKGMENALQYWFSTRV